MIRLIRSDFYRLLKTKITYISLGIVFLLPIIMAALYAGLIALLADGDEEAASALGMMINARSLINTTFSLTNNFGIVLPVFSVIIIMSDISNGTIRNKIMIGYKRQEIFASHFITTFIYCLVTMGIYAGMTMLWSSVILQTTDLTSSEMISYLYFYVLGFLSLAVIVGIGCCLSLATLNSAGSIIITLVITIILGFVSSLLSGFDFPEVTEHILRFIPYVVISTISYKEITVVMFLEGLGGVLLFAGLLYGLGTYIFIKRDLK